MTCFSHVLLLSLSHAKHLFHGQPLSSTQLLDLEPDAHLPSCYLVYPVSRREQKPLSRMSLSNRSKSPFSLRSQTNHRHNDTVGTAIWTTFLFVLSVPFGAIVPKLILRSENQYLKYCSGSPCPPYPSSSSNIRHVILTNLRAQTIGTCLLLAPTIYANYFGTVHLDSEIMQVVIAYFSVWILLGFSMVIGIGILNSLTVDYARMDPVKLLKITVPAALCTTLITAALLLIMAAVSTFWEWMDQRTWRICGSGKQAV
ncbi:hypothetical protein DL96DRAFT_1188322 [Flagelloscypha sp. PMI_526]|nr:hypothetical protein DL96DRAFT_1188322 [Flagelloscypha sp. PMI_526]